MIADVNEQANPFLRQAMINALHRYLQDENVLLSYWLDYYWGQSLSAARKRLRECHPIELTIELENIVGR